MRQMQLLAPQIKEMQRKYKGDKKKQQEELMRLYQENNANPFASCLPLVAQIPVFLGLYYGLKRFSNHGRNGFGPVVPAHHSEHHRARERPAAVVGGGAGGDLRRVPAAVDRAVVRADTRRTCSARSCVSSRFRSCCSPSSYPFPAGVAIYWVTTNLWTAGSDAHHQAPHRPAPPGGRSAARRRGRRAPRQRPSRLRCLTRRRRS